MIPTRPIKSPDDLLSIAEALELQQGVPLVCGRCGKRSRSGGIDQAALESCPDCQGPLEPITTVNAAKRLFSSSAAIMLRL